MTALQMPEDTVTRLCVSLAVHEQPAVVLDQVENIRAFLPQDTVIVLHVSPALATPRDVAPFLPPGVLVNPTQVPTVYGDGSLVAVHNSNVRHAASVEDFDRVLLHASNDLYVRPPSIAHVAAHQAAYHQQVTAADGAWWPTPRVFRDQALASMLRTAGGGQVLNSQVEGTFYDTELFLAMADVIDSAWTSGTGEPYQREEVYYPTLARAMGRGRVTTPLLYFELLGLPITRARVLALASGTHADVPTNGDGGGYRVYDFAQLCAVKRVPRLLDDPLREVIRTLGRARSPRPRIRPAFTDRPVVVVSTVEEAVSDPLLLHRWVEEFHADSAVTLALVVAHDRAPAVLPDLQDLATSSGLAVHPQVDAVVVPVTTGSFEEASLRWAADAYLGGAAEAVPVLYADLPAYAPGDVAHLHAYCSYLATGARP